MLALFGVEAFAQTGQTDVAAEEGEVGSARNPFATSAAVASRAFDVAVEAIVCVLYVVIVVIVNVAIFCRYVLDSPLVWGDTVAIWAFVWMAMLSAALALRKGAHMRIDVLRARIHSRRARLVLQVLVDGSIVLTGFLLAASGLEFVRIAGDRRATTMDLPVSIAIYAIPVGATCCVIYGLRNLARTIRHPEDSEESVNNEEVPL